MKSNTDALVRLKTEQQKILDFTVLCCHSMPNLSKTIHGVESKVKDYGLAKPIHFKLETHERLKGLIKGFDKDLGKYIIFSSWSYFEFYFKDCMAELLDFYGGKEVFLRETKLRIQEKMTRNEALFEGTKKIREKAKKGKEQKYKKVLDHLVSQGYIRTNELFSAYGAKQFVNEVAKGNFVSADIPQILEDLFGFDLSEKVNQHGELIDMDMKQTYDSMRDFRNKIGHGEVVSASFDKVMAYNRFLRILAVKVDSYLIKNFFILNSI